MTLRSLGIGRKILPLPILLTGLFLPAAAQVSAVVNAASQISGAVSPGSIVTIFGTTLAPAVTVGVGSPTPPAALGGVNVTVGGVPAGLYYVSPTQINAVLSASTPTGTQNLTVSSSAGTFTKSIIVSTTAQPGIFSLLGNGTGDGAIINPFTLAIGTFTVRSGEESTFLSIFLTGLDLTTNAAVTVGGLPVKVLFAGKSPCCAGLQQINVQLPETLSGAGRVPLSVQSGTQVSNTVEIVLLPAAGEGAFRDDEADRERSRELASLAYIPGTSLVLVADENDDVIRVINIQQRAVVQTISLPNGSGPVAVSVTADGLMAVVTERRSGQIALIDLTTYSVLTQLTVGAGARNVAIAGNLAVIVNGYEGTISIANLTSRTVLKTLTTGSGAHAVIADPVTLKAWITNQDAGTISVIDLVTFTVSNTITLGDNIRPASIRRVAGTNFAVVAVPVAGNMGTALIVNLTTGSFSTISVNPDLSGGSSDIAVNGPTLFFANQTGASISIVQIAPATGLLVGTPLIVKVDLGARALAVDTKDNLLIVTNQGSGTIVLVDLTTYKVVGRIVAVKSGDDDNADDHSDHDKAKNLPVLNVVAPVTARATSTFTLALTGTGLAGTSQVLFVNPSFVNGNGKGKGKGDSPDLNADSAFSVSNVVVNGAGTSVTAIVTMKGAALGARIVLVKTPNGESVYSKNTTSVLTVIP